MAITLAELTTRIRRNTTTYNNIPNAEQIAEAISRAFSDLADKAPHLRSSTINVVAGTAAYNLPADFHAIKSFDLATGGGYMIGDTMYGSSSTYTEIIKVEDGQLKISPTPTANQTRTLEYYARHILTTGTYPYCEERHVNAVIWRAILYICLAKAAEAERVSWTETQGDVRVDKSGIFKAIMVERENAEKEWNNALAAIVDPTSGYGGGFGKRSSYNTNPYDAWTRTDLLTEGY